MKLYAMTTARGDVCPETVLTEEEYADPVRVRSAESRARHTRGADAPLPGTWIDVTVVPSCQIEGLE